MISEGKKKMLLDTEKLLIGNALDNLREAIDTPSLVLSEGGEEKLKSAMADLADVENSLQKKDPQDIDLP